MIVSGSQYFYDDLPYEIKKQIVSYNELPEKNKWMRVNKIWNKIANEKDLWKKLEDKLHSFGLFKQLKNNSEIVNSLYLEDLFLRRRFLYQPFHLLPYGLKKAAYKKIQEIYQIFFNNPNRNISKEDIKEFVEIFIKDQLVLKENPLLIDDPLVEDPHLIRYNHTKDNDGYINWSKEKIRDFDRNRIIFNDSLEAEIDLLHESTQIESFNKLEDLNKAINNLLVWELLSKLVPNDKFKANFASYNTTSDLIDQANQLEKWCLKNQNVLFNITTLDFSPLQDKEPNSLPEVIWQFLPNLASLYLNGLKLISLPDSIGFCNNLIEIWLDSNCLAYLPESFSQLQNLRQLHLAYNAFTLLPECILNLKNLECLDLGFNYLSSLPDISNLKELTHLSFNHNHLSSLPDNISELKELRFLSVKHNHLSSLPDSILDLQNLQKIDISENNGKLIGIHLPHGYHLTNLANAHIISDMITELTANVSSHCTIQ